MNPSLQLLAISGSLRAASSNTTVLQALAALAPDGVAVTPCNQLAELPYFNPDLDSDVLLPAAVHDFRSQIGQADGLLISSPEYAHGVPGVLKNALDWLVGSVEFPYKPVALINISPRSIYVQASLAEILKTMSATLISDPSFTITMPLNRLDAVGMLADPSIREALQKAITTFVQSVKDLSKV